ncbi:hypothetical protein [Tepidibacter aestuarii]|uniref:hypothetical protein n=1 Tax=Tepidibacter aestuarii TaxID=2925782 RepID=UPI0020BEA509|nr:hypothetical protein [Tepidibacter aestuarii]
MYDIMIENNIRSLGVDKNEFKEAIGNMVETALIDRCTLTNPKQPTKEDLINIYRIFY